MNNNQGRIRIEKETTITFNEEESHAIVWTASDITERKLLALGLNPEKFGGGIRVEIPKGWVKFRKPRDLTEDQKEELKKRGKALSLRSPHVASKGKTI